jgi:thioredoxin reductase (NADPH)
VYVIHRRDSFRASKAMQARILDNPKAEPVWNSVVVDVLGNDFIEGLLLENVLTKERTTLPVRGLFIAIGHSPATKFLQGAGLEFDEKGYIALTKRSSHTNIEGVFAAGDVADSTYRQAITASGMGCQAAMDAERWLAERGVH